MAPKDDMKIKPDKDGNWFIQPEQREQMQPLIKKHLEANRNAKDPRAGFGTVHIWDKTKNAYDEKIISNYQKYLERDSSINIGFNSKERDLAKKFKRSTRERPQVDQITEYAFRVGDTQADVDQYLEDRRRAHLDFKKENKSLNIRGAIIDADPIEIGHGKGLDTPTPGKPNAIAPTSPYNFMQEPKYFNRGVGAKGGSNKTINLDIAAGAMARTWPEDYEFWRTQRRSRLTGEINPFMNFNEEFTLDERSKLLAVPADAPKTESNKVLNEIFDERKKVEKRIGIKTYSGTKKPLNAKGLYRNIAKAAGQSNNPLVNVSGDIVGAVMDGVAFAGDPTYQNGIDLALSGSQAVISLAAMGLAAVPIPGGRPGAFMLMKVGDSVDKLRAVNNKIAQVERLWNMGREGVSKSKLGQTKVQLPEKVQKSLGLIQKQDLQNKLFGRYSKSNTNF